MVLDVDIVKYKGWYDVGYDVFVVVWLVCEKMFGLVLVDVWLYLLVGVKFWVVFMFEEWVLSVWWMEVYVVMVDYFDCVVGWVIVVLCILG